MTAIEGAYRVVNHTHPDVFYALAAFQLTRTLDMGRFTLAVCTRDTHGVAVHHLHSGVARPEFDCLDSQGRLDQGKL